MLYYQNDKKPKYSIGNVINVNNYNINHNCIIKNSSFGGPLFNLSNYKIIDFIKRIIQVF